MKKFTEIHGNSMMRFWRYRSHEEYSGYRIHGNSIVGVFTKKDRKEGILMFNFLNSESLWIGTDMKKFNEIRTQLEKEGIPYKYKTKDHLSQTMYPAEGTLRSRTGSFGNKPDQMIEYEILVHKKDYEKVRGKFWFAQQRRRFPRKPIPYICDFSRCRLNVRLTARIQPLLRGHKYRVSAFFGSCLLAAHANSEFILRKIWGRLQTVVAFWKIEILEDWHLSYHFKLFDIITIFGRFPGFIHLPYNFFAFFSIFTANWSVRIVGMVFQTRSS